MINYVFPSIKSKNGARVAGAWFAFLRKDNSRFFNIVTLLMSTKYGSGLWPHFMSALISF